MYETDNILYGGMYQRVNPILDTTDIFKLLKVYNFDAPLINTNNFTIEYSVFKKLLDDVRFLNLPYAGYDKRKYFENKKYFIYNEISKNIIDSLDILKVPFNNILELGINDKLIINYLKERFPSCSITSADIDISLFPKKTDQKFIEIDLDNLQIGDNTVSYTHLRAHET